MAKFLLLGDSNIANNLQHQAILGKGQFDFKKCTTKGLFIDKILAAQLDFIVVAGIDCIVNEALSAPRESERSISLVLNNLVSKIVEKIEDDNSANVTIVIVSPLYWDDFNDDVKKSLQNTFKQIRKDWKHLIKFIPPCPGMAYMPDKIHLNELSGVRYLNHIIKKACSLAKIIPTAATNPSWADDVELQQMEDEEMEQDDSQMPPPVDRNISAGTQGYNQLPLPSQPMTSTALSHHQVPAQFSQQFQHFVPPPVSQSSFVSNPFPQILTIPAPAPAPTSNPTNQDLLQKIENLVKRVESVEDKAFYDNLMFAAIKEDQDDVVNRANLNKVTVTGVQITNFNRMAENEKPAAMKEAVNAIIALVTADAEREKRKVVFVRHRNHRIRNAKAAVIEARFEDANQATSFRKDFVAKVKQLTADKQLPDELSGISTYPVQTLGTRVRATLLKAMANVVTEVSSAGISAYCMPFITRPLMKIVTKTNDSSNPSIQSFSFVESIMKLRSYNDLRRVSLNDAYQLAGSTFRGRLEQHFIILKD